MIEHPVLFSGDMVRAILDNRKTMARSVVKGIALEWLESDMFTPEYVAMPENNLRPYGKIGNRLWVKETHYLYGRWVKNGFSSAGKQKWRFGYEQIKGVMFPDNPPEKICSKRGEIGWFYRPPIHMPRWASRITLEITNIRVERLQEITEEDCDYEGVVWFEEDGSDMIDKFRKLWDSINGKKNPWSDNPWVWVREFKRIKRIYDVDLLKTKGGDGLN